MFKITFLLLISMLSCADSTPDDTDTVSAKDYTAVHLEALAFCKEQKFNEDYYFLIDMSVHSGKNRFFIYDFKENKVTAQNLATHGSCDVFEENNTRVQKAAFSNRADSHCSSKGKYKIGSRDYSSWGIHVKYWLEGLEETNSNAKDRVVVLHSWTAVSDTEIYPSYSPLSWGCPAVSDNFMRKLDTKLQQAKKPVLLWIID